jgi:hypothetical protein
VLRFELPDELDGPIPDDQIMVNLVEATRDLPACVTPPEIEF